MSRRGRPPALDAVLSRPPVSTARQVRRLGRKMGFLTVLPLILFLVLVVGLVNGVRAHALARDLRKDSVVARSSDVTVVVRNKARSGYQIESVTVQLTPASGKPQLLFLEGVHGQPVNVRPGTYLPGHLHCDCPYGTLPLEVRYRPSDPELAMAEADYESGLPGWPIAALAAGIVLSALLLAWLVHWYRQALRRLHDLEPAPPESR